MRKRAKQYRQRQRRRATAVADGRTPGTTTRSVARGTSRSSPRRAGAARSDARPWTAGPSIHNRLRRRCRRQVGPRCQGRARPAGIRHRNCPPRQSHQWRRWPPPTGFAMVAPRHRLIGSAIRTRSLLYHKVAAHSAIQPMTGNVRREISIRHYSRQCEGPRQPSKSAVRPCRGVSQRTSHDIRGWRRLRNHHSPRWSNASEAGARRSGHDSTARSDGTARRKVPGCLWVRAYRRPGRARSV